MYHIARNKEKIKLSFQVLFIFENFQKIFKIKFYSFLIILFLNKYVTFFKSFTK